MTAELLLSGIWLPKFSVSRQTENGNKAEKGEKREKTRIVFYLIKYEYVDNTKTKTF
jgi:hypothetical protein